MINKNRYYHRSKTSEAKFRQLVRCFALDFTAVRTAELTGLLVRSVNSIYLRIRGRIAECCELESPLQGAVEVDESYLERIACAANEGAAPGKTIVFGLLKRRARSAPRSCRKASLNS